MSRRNGHFASGSQPQFRRTLLAVTLASVSCSALAEEALDLGQVVVTASGFEQNLRDAPAAITVITEEELKRLRTCAPVRPTSVPLPWVG